ncbi:hypothetical protein GLGCALEP_01634 [Pseudomonas sp. MM221]|nr:hypothetical protein DBADOPDK_01592 [Pseudomonas sp. MM223]CAI3797145.1 hypothetical protein GLGCALEP_01634 [Pseudomonas sp. MM221]
MRSARLVKHSTEDRLKLIPFVDDSARCFGNYILLKLINLHGEDTNGSLINN